MNPPWGKRFAPQTPWTRQRRGQGQNHSSWKEAGNRAHNITPKTIIKEVKSTIGITQKKQAVSADKIKAEDIPDEIEKLKALMKVASNQLDFEKAIEIRDTINLLRRRLRRN